MLRTGRKKNRASAVQLPAAAKGLSLLFAVCVVIRVFSAVSMTPASSHYITGLTANSGLADSILSFELGNWQQSGSPDLASVVLGLSVNASRQNTGRAEETIAAPADNQTGETGSEVLNPGDAWLYYNFEDNQQNIGSDTISGTPPNIITNPAAETNPEVIAVNNKTSYTIDTAVLLKEPLKLTLSANEPAVLIVHTHSSEAYMPDGQDTYVESDPYRTEDKTYSVIRVGDELADALNEKGVSCIHDRSIYDYPSYQGAYNRSYESIQDYLKKYPSIKVVIDLHRDAIQAQDGSVYKTIAEVDGTKCSQVMMVIGSNSSGLQHPNWRENLKLAVRLQNELDKLYPSLAKPIELSQYRYNQQATIGSMIVEVGCTGNTLQESMSAVRYFADAASNVLLKLQK